MERTVDIVDDGSILKIEVKGSDFSFKLVYSIEEKLLMELSSSNIDVNLKLPTISSLAKAKIEKKKGGEESVLRRYVVLKPSKTISDELMFLLKSKGAFSVDNALSLDEIIEIIEKERERYPLLAEIIDKHGIGGARKRIALALAGALRRKGLVKYYKIRKAGYEEYMYYTSQSVKY